MLKYFAPVKIERMSGLIEVLDQRLVPAKEEYRIIKTAEDAFEAISQMIVRGAPLIGFTGLAGLVVFLKGSKNITIEEIQNCVSYLESSRPTAINLKYELNDGLKYLKNNNLNDENVWQHLLDFLQNKIADLDAKNSKMAEFFLIDIQKRFVSEKLNLITICNTGRLACATRGTALGCIEYAHEKNILESVFACETRPYLQGARLTSFELQKANIKHQIIVEGAMAHVMSKYKIHAVLAGADRIATNGDTANKIGTHTLAIVAKRFNIPFYIVAPLSSFDLDIKDGSQIPVELRDENEIHEIQGVRITPQNSRAFNPSFDITPVELITGGIICERGIFKRDEEYKDVRSWLKDV